MKSYFYIVIVLFVSFILFTACGGTDCEGSDCNEPADEISVMDENEVTDDTTDETVDEVADDVVDDSVDSEPDEDAVPVACEEDSECKEICKNFLDYAGDWTIVDMSFTGDVALDLSVEGVECKISVTGTWSFSWQGTALPLECAESTGWTYFFYLQGMEGKRMVFIQSDSIEFCQKKSGVTITLEKK